MPLRRSIRNSTAEAARRLYARAVEQARRPEFYTVGGVPDTLDGRFEMLCVHVFLLLYRLKAEAERAADFARLVAESMVDDMDASLREMGAGDLGVGRRVKGMAGALYGRMAAYEEGLGDDRLIAAVARNVYGTAAPPTGAAETMAAYLRQGTKTLARQPLEALLAGRVEFGPALAPAPPADSR